jgi:hypothetical protein
MDDGVHVLFSPIVGTGRTGHVQMAAIGPHLALGAAKVGLEILEVR